MGTVVGAELTAVVSTHGGAAMSDTTTFFNCVPPLIVGMWSSPVSAEAKVADAVIAVPSYFSEQQRCSPHILGRAHIGITIALLFTGFASAAGDFFVNC